MPAANASIDSSEDEPAFETVACRFSVLELAPPPDPADPVDPTADGPHKPYASVLPNELIDEILGFVPHGDQQTFASFARVCRQWYFASISYLYRRPKITSKSYAKFVRTLCPAIASRRHKPTPLATLIRCLDLSQIVHEGKASYTARLLRRTAPSLEEFVAPQVSFGVACVAVLGHLTKLRHLDLSLVSHSVNLNDLFRQIHKLPDLRTVDFPRSSTYAPPVEDFAWPPSLRCASLAGSIPSVFLPRDTTSLPKSLKELHLSHFPTETQANVLGLVAALGPQLTSLSISYRIPRLSGEALDFVLSLCPCLTHLRVAVDYMSPDFFSPAAITAPHPLRRLELDSTGDLRMEEKIEANDVFDAVAEGRLPSLRILRVSSRLAWLKRTKEDVEELVELLEAMAEEAGERPEDAGVWEFESARINSRGFAGYS